MPAFPALKKDRETHPGGQCKSFAVGSGTGKTLPRESDRFRILETHQGGGGLRVA